MGDTRSRSPHDRSRARAAGALLQLRRPRRHVPEPELVTDGRPIAFEDSGATTATASSSGAVPSLAAAARCRARRQDGARGRPPTHRAPPTCPRRDGQPPAPDDTVHPRREDELGLALHEQVAVQALRKGLVLKATALAPGTPPARRPRGSREMAGGRSRSARRAGEAPAPVHVLGEAHPARRRQGAALAPRHLLGAWRRAASRDAQIVLR